MVPAQGVQRNTNQALRAKGKPTHEVEDFRLDEGLAVIPFARHLQNVEQPLKYVVRDLEQGLCIASLGSMWSVSSDRRSSTPREGFPMRI